MLSGDFRRGVPSSTSGLTVPLRGTPEYAVFHDLAHRMSKVLEVWRGEGFGVGFQGLPSRGNLMEIRERPQAACLTVV